MSFSLQEQFTGFIRTPSIFAEDTFFKYPLYKTDRSYDPKSLVELTEPNSRVLGKRMEHFFHFYITHFSPQQMLTHNRQIILNKQTLGELDFLLKEPHSSRVAHIELIYKFYLYEPGTGISEKDHLIGPNKRDTLNQKLDRLKKRQFPLLFNEAAQELLEDLKINPTAVDQKMCFKAFIFLPRDQENINFSEINPATVSGYWIREEDFSEAAYGHNLFYSPKKKYWPVSPKNNREWFTYTEIRERLEPFMERQLSMLLWMKTPTGKLEKFFIVWW